MINITFDIGNTITTFCMFKKNKLLKHAKIPKDKLNLKTLKVLKDKFFLNKKVKVLISSVVPKSEKIIKSFLRDNSISFFSIKDLLKKIEIKINIKKKKKLAMIELLI